MSDYNKMIETYMKNFFQYGMHLHMDSVWYKRRRRAFEIIEIGNDLDPDSSDVEV